MRTLPLAAQNKATEDTGAKGLATSHGGAAMSTAAAATRGDTLHAVSLAAAAAAAGAAVHFNATARLPDRTLPRAQARSTSQPAHQSAAADHSVTAPAGQDFHDAAAPSSPRLRSRKRKVTLTLGDKIATIRMYDSGAHTWRSLQAAFLKEVSLSAVRRTCEPQERARLLKRGRDGEPLDAARTRWSKFEQIDAALTSWFDGIESMGGADLPMTMAVLETIVLKIAADLGVEGFLGTPRFIQRWRRDINLRASNDGDRRARQRQLCVKGSSACRKYARSWGRMIQNTSTIWTRRVCNIGASQAAPTLRRGGDGEPAVPRPLSLKIA